jgi:hypothetical protein
MGHGNGDDVAAARDGDGGIGRDAIPPYGEGYKDLSGHQRNAGGDPKGLAEKVRRTCSVRRT